MDDKQRQELKLFYICRYNFKPIIEAGLYSIIDQPYMSMQFKQQLAFIFNCYGSSYIYNNNSLQKMFNKLAQFKNFIAHAITSLESQKPTLPTDQALPNKISFMLDHIMKQPLALQFKAYHQLQAPEINLNQLLSQIYHANNISTQQVVAILHFYSFLLLNCQNQLVLCKIVSDSFVLELTEIFTNRLHQFGESPYVDLQEVNSYKIALVKAYVSRLQQQTAKYMVLGQRMRIFESCVRFCTSFQGKKQWGVEITCMSNCVLLIAKFIANNQQYYTFCFQQNGMNSLLTHLVTLIHQSIMDMLTASESFEEELQSLKSSIMFTIDLINNITLPEYRTTLIQKTFQKLTDLRDLFQKLVNRFTQKIEQQTQFMKILQLIKVLLKLLSIYFKTEQLKELFELSLIPILDKFIIQFNMGLKKISLDKQSSKLQIKKELHLFCSITQILALILQQGGYLSRRNNASLQEKQLKAVVVNRIVDIIELLLSDHASSIAQNICSKSIKLLLLSLMQLTIQNYHTLHQYSVLRLHQYYINHVRHMLKKNQVWDYVVLHYQSLLKQASQSLLMVDSIQPSQYQYCQSHDPYRNRDQSSTEIAVNAILLNQYARNFRFMIVETTYISINSIKLQKSYHTNFISQGWSFVPGREVEVQVKEMCRLTHLSNELYVPITVIIDEECLIFAHIESNLPKKVILNIRYKMVEGFTPQKDILRIKLKGAQQIVISGDKSQMAKFREYLIEKRDRARQRQLKFIHHSLDKYYEDNAKVIAEIGQKQIEDLSNHQQESIQKPKQEQVNNAQQQKQPKQQTQMKNEQELTTLLI